MVSQLTSIPGCCSSAMSSPRGRSIICHRCGPREHCASCRAWLGPRWDKNLNLDGRWPDLSESVTCYVTATSFKATPDIVIAWKGIIVSLSGSLYYLPLGPLTM